VNAAGEVGTWLGLIIAAWNTGLFATHWSRASAPRYTGSVFAAAAPVALAWASLTGAALRGDPALAVVAQRVVVDAGPLYRVAAVLTSSPGTLLTVAFLLSMLMLMTPAARPGESAGALRIPTVYSAATALALALLVGRWTPFAGAGALGEPVIPLALIHPGAALRGLLAAGAVAAMVHGLAWLVSARGTRETAGDAATRRSVAIGLMLATLSLGADQLARAQLASAPAADGRNAAGVVLWVALALLTHDRVRGALRGARDGWVGAPRRPPAVLTHVGAACLVIAFGAHVVAKRAAITLAPGQPVETSDVFGRRWSLVNQGVSRFDDRGRDVAAVAIEVQGPSGRRLMTSQLAAYHQRVGEGTTFPVATRGVAAGMLQTVLVTLDRAAPDDAASVRISFIPFAGLWFPAVALLVAGTLLMASAPAAPRRESRPVSLAVAAAADELVRRWRLATVDCPVCGRRPEPDSRFCSSCGRALLPCARCGAVTAEPMARHCARCGAALAWPAGGPGGHVSARSIPAAVAPDATE
jgi:cytochrome c biogenesis factor